MELAKLVFILLMKKLMLKIGKLVVLLLFFDVVKTYKSSTYSNNLLME